MSELVIQPELMVELSADEQQLIAGGRRFCPQRVFVSRRCGFYVPGRRPGFGKRGGGRRGRGFDEFEDDFEF
jgi:hypothetical protein